MQSGRLRSWAIPYLGAICLTCFALALAGCRDSAQSKAQEIDPASAEPEDLLQGMLAAYAQAETYSDRAAITFRFVAAGRAEEDTTVLSVAFARPEQLRLELDFGDANILLADDGETLRARILAEESENFDNQFVERAAPEKLHCGSLYEATTLVVPGSDSGSPPLSVLEGPYVRLEQLPLGLLLGDSQLPAIIADSENVTELRGREFEGHACRRVRIEAPEGEFTFWIDRENLVLRKIVYPASMLVAGQVAPGVVRDASLVVEFHDAQLNELLPEDTFALAKPVGARVVRQFVQPVLDPPPAHLGEHVPQFALVTLGGEPVPSSNWQDETVVLFFFDNHPDCGVAAAHVEQVLLALAAQREASEETSNVHVLGVCTESPETFSNNQLRTLAARWQISFPVLRDPAAAGRDLLHVLEAPAVVVLDGERRVQYAQAGASAELSQELAAVIARLGEGEDLAREHLEYYAEQSRLYSRAVGAVEEGREEEIIELPDPERPLPARDDPKHLAIEELWSLDQLEAPGNMLVVPGAEGSDDTVYVLDGWRTVVQLDAAGGVARRIELELPEQAAVSFLRYGVDGQGRVWFAGTSRLAQQAFLFDDQWQLVLSYPDADTVHPGVQDVLPADLDGSDDGPLRLYVALWETGGVHAVDLDGTQAWRNRSVQPSLSLTLSPPSAVGWQNLLVTSNAGTIVPINRFGNAEAGSTPGSGGVHGLFAGRQWLAAGAALAGYAVQADGRIVMKGIDQELAELWRYTMPGGLAPGVQAVTSGKLVPDVPMQWLFAGADGSLHVISADTELVDWFHFGSRIDGAGIAQLGGEPLLLVSSDGQVTALRVSWKPVEEGE